MVKFETVDGSTEGIYFERRSALNNFSDIDIRERDIGTY